MLIITQKQFFAIIVKPEYLGTQKVIIVDGW